MQDMVSYFTGNEPVLTPGKDVLTPEIAITVSQALFAESNKAVKELGYNDEYPVEKSLDESIGYLAELGLLQLPTQKEEL